MLYPQTSWKDHVTQYENRYQHSTNPDGSVTHTPVPGQILQQGTPQNQPNFDNIEFGVQDAYIATQILLAYVMQKGRDMDAGDAALLAQINAIKADAADEVKTVTLNNTQTFPFNSSQQSVPITAVRNNLNYDVICEVTAFTGNIGEIVVSDRQLNGFKVEFTGSATSVTLKIRIQGGMLS
jgi:hypothetical protein